MAPAPETWEHTDTALAEHLSAGLRRCGSGDWSSGSDASRVDAFRAVLADSCMTISGLVTAPRLRVDESRQLAIADIRPEPGMRNDHLVAAGRLYGTFKTFQRLDDGGFAGGLVTRASGDAAGFLAGVAVVTVIAVGGIAIGFCAERAAQIIDRQLKRREDTQRLMATHVAALNVVQQHQQREEEAGKPLPIDSATESVLRELSAQQRGILESRDEPLASLVPVAPEVSIKSFGAGAALVAALGAGYWLLKGK